MPIRKVAKGWTFGGAVYSTKTERAYRAYLAKEKKK